MSKVFAPACQTVTDCAPYEWCPPVLSACNGNGCISVTTCEAVYIPIEIPTCNPFTGISMTTDDIASASLKISGTTQDGDEDRHQIFGAYSLDDAIAVSYPDKLVFAPTADETSTWPSGVVTAHMTVTDTSGNTFQLVRDFNLCVERPVLADACLVVGGEEMGTVFSIVNDTVTLYLHNSDTGDVSRDWAEFTIDWGDGTIETITPTIPMTAANSAYSHTYTAQPTGGIVVSGTTTFDAANPCDEALTDCTDEICLPELVI